MGHDPHTSTEAEEGSEPALGGRAGLRLEVVSGPDRGRSLVLAPGSYVVGQAPDASLSLRDRKVSRRHLAVEVRADRVVVRDLGSRNGSWFGGARFTELAITLGAVIRIGASELALSDGGDGARESFGGLIGRSAAMQKVYALLERIARSDAPVLVVGETGTGKEVCAEAIHAASARAGGPFVVCDCAALAPSVIESELFGHLRGAFTGADVDRAGAFALADGGTLFIDEIGELELEAQPRLLRALDACQVKPVGASGYRTVDVRVIAATNRDLREDVRAGRFRADLYHRLSVLRVELPPLRERKEDLQLLLRSFARGRPFELTDEAKELMLGYQWPGNVRELRNVVERARSLAPGARLPPSALGLGAPGQTQPTFHQAKEYMIANWERGYLADLLDRTRGNVSRAARVAGLDRVTLYRLIKKHGIPVEHG